MAASTIPNSGGPGSSVELSPTTIAVRDKVIEKFADQPLDEMNESVKKLLSIEKDEQKRLGILAARVYILRQRIMNLAETDAERVVGSSSPKVDDLALNSSDNLQDDAGNSDWTRLRILQDCEVNGVRFPKTVIIDVKSEDALRMVESGKAEVIANDPAPASDMSGDMGEAPAGELSAEDAAGAGETTSEDRSTDLPEDSASEESTDEISALSALDSEAMPADEAKAAPEMVVEEAPEATPAVEEEGSEEDAPNATAPTAETETEAVIEAPSAAEVTAALEALSNEPDDTPPVEAAPVEETPAEATLDSGEAESADVAAELEALSAAFASPAADADDKATDGEGGEDKPSGWFEAQQNAEKAAREDVKSDTNDEDGDAKG